MRWSQVIDLSKTMIGRCVVAAIILACAMVTVPFGFAMAISDSLSVNVTVEARNYLCVTMTGTPSSAGQLIRTGSPESGSVTWVVLDD